jgi:hypothetical protein
MQFSLAAFTLAIAASVNAIECPGGGVQDKALKVVGFTGGDAAAFCASWQTAWFVPYCCTCDYLFLTFLCIVLHTSLPMPLLYFMEPTACRATSVLVTKRPRCVPLPVLLFIAA